MLTRLLSRAAGPAFLLALMSVPGPPGALARVVSVPSTEIHALVGGRVLLRPGVVLDEATVLIRDGKIVAVGPSASVAVPEGARRWDVTGHVVHAGFIDSHLGLSRFNGVPEGKDDGEKPSGKPPQPGPAASASGSGHEKVHPEIRVRDWLAPDAKALQALRAQGFTTACVVPDRGILRGRDCVVALDGGAPGRSVIRELGDVHAAFEAGGWGSDLYPNSVMGATAVLRQALLDADWYRRARPTEVSPRVAEDAALEALASVLPERGRSRGPRPRIAFDCADVLDVLRAGTVASEFGAGLRLRAAGDEYRRLADVVALGAPLTVPVTFPPAPTVVDETEWIGVSDEQLRHWRFAPDNARWLREAGASVSLTTDGLKDVDSFTERVRRAIERGLRPEDALAMLTTEPAAQLGLSNQLGSIEPGKLAHLIVSTGEPFAEGAEIRDAWIDGRRIVVSLQPEGPVGHWSVSVNHAGRSFPARLDLGPDGSLSWEKGVGGPGDEGSAGERKAEISALRVEGERARFEVEGEPFDLSSALSLVATARGTSLTATASGAAFSLSGTRTAKKKSRREGSDEEATAPLRPPQAAGGALTAGDDLLLKDATVWTSAPAGILQGVDVLVRDGVISAIGPGLAAPSGVETVEMAGRHLTPGLIDAHSHTAIVGGVNEGTNSCTAEVRIGDVVNSETIDIYRLLAGGLTTANLLHGSANCMGGQSQVIRLAWGASPEGLKFREAWPMIKFALGENVKQSNWGAEHVTRFPQTRMGVEQFMREKFQEARDWDEHWRAKPVRGRAPARRDLQLECLAEILRGERKIHCHSYRQDEILGLMKVAEEFGFRVGTFQHILEGYKVADEMAAHGAGASSFTDWWGYKFEVYDAIPHNPALMWERGVLTSVNSDSTELARRMQLEAAKVVKWGGVPEAEALGFVTSNPARQMGIDHLVGSIEVGKQADLAAWSGSPLSTSSLCEMTWIQGRKYFDRSLDLAGREARARERAEMIELARKAASKGDDKGERWDPAYLHEVRGCSESGGVHSHDDEVIQ